MNWAARTICWTLVASLFACSSIAAAQGFVDERYQLPLVGSYGVYREGGGYERDAGRHRLVRMEHFSSGTVAYGDVVTKLSQVAVAGRFIVGQSDGGWFLLDTAAERPEPVTFASEEAWRSALAAAGVPHGIQLATPDSLAAAVLDTTLRPWNYRVMRGLLGQSDSMWSLIIQIIGILLSLVIGFYLQSRSAVMPIALLGWSVDVVAQMIIAGEGPGAFVGLFAFPIMYWIAIMFGRSARELVRPRRGCIILNDALR